jgi:hypothetical protein
LGKFSVKHAVLFVMTVAVAATGDRFVRAQSSPGAPNAQVLIDRYAAGEHEAVARELAAVRDFEALRKSLEKLLPGWTTTAGASERPRRTITAASLLLEVTHAGLETDWIQLKTLVELGCRMLHAGSVPSEAERLWMLASVALGGGGRDAAFLIGGPEAITGSASVREHLNHARRRFPGESRFSLAAAMAEEIRSAGEPSRDRTRASSQIEQLQAVLRRNTIQRFMKVAGIPALAAEAEMHIGYLWFQFRNGAEALKHLRIAHERSADPYVTYLAHFFAGRVLLEEKRMALAEAAFRDALATLPGTQSASQALAALLFIDGRRDEAYALIETSYNQRPLQPDPWRLYGYGDYRRWPALILQLREAIK